MSARGWFVTGTDTGVGKTSIAVAMIHMLRAQGLRVAAMKPVSAGSEPGQLNADVVALMHASNVEAAVADVNPYAFPEAVAPHIAAQHAGVRIEVPVIVAAFGRLAAVSDVVVVEGAGGWRVPLNDSEDMADLARALDLPVVLVVGLRLGCLNHAVLTAESIAASQLKWAGWIGNHLEPAMPDVQANIETLQARLPGPCMGLQEYRMDSSGISESPQWLNLQSK